MQALTKLKGSSSEALESLRLEPKLILPRNSGNMDGDRTNAWIQSLSMYFDSQPRMVNTKKLEWEALHLDGIALEWWQNLHDRSTL